MLKKIRDILEESSVPLSVFIPFCVGLLLCMVFLFVSNFLETQWWLEDLLSNSAFYMLGWSGAAMIITKEPLPPEYGKRGERILAGGIIAIISWGFNIFYLITLFMQFTVLPTS